MKRILLAAASLATVLAGGAAADDMHKMLNLGAMQWVPSPRLPRGTQVSIVYGDPRKEGHYVILAKMPDGYSIPAHWHNQVENVTVISGTFNVGMGDRLDKTSGEALGPGGFFSSGPGCTITHGRQARLFSRSPGWDRSTSSMSIPRMIPPTQRRTSTLPMCERGTPPRHVPAAWNRAVDSVHRI